MKYKKVNFFNQSYNHGDVTTSLSGGYHIYNTLEEDTYRIQFKHGGSFFIKIDTSNETEDQSEIFIVIKRNGTSKELKIESSVFNGDGVLDELVEQELCLIGIQPRHATALDYAVFGLLNNGPFLEYQGAFEVS
ncbi:hypothetical protein [Pseudoalteromonas sp. CH_XMU1449-3]|uniref:hypothetical protein n=1 Tax=Pseudoalteromonas sp. CH_XMU1449-3 TaxID=3107774 RepID=UPI00300A01EC